MTTCMMTSPPARCTLPVGHDGPHATREGYGWHDSDDMGVSVTAALIEKETEQDEGAHIGPEGETDWHGLYLSENRRAEKAERALAEMTAHRDQCRDIATKWQVEANRLRGEQSDPSVDYHAMWWKAEKEREQAERERDEWQAEAEQASADALHYKRLLDDSRSEIKHLIEQTDPRPLAVTDEMVERAYSVAMDFISTAGASRSAIFSILTAALALESARHPEAARIEKALTASLPGPVCDQISTKHLKAIADRMAERGVRAPGSDQ